MIHVYTDLWSAPIRGQWSWTDSTISAHVTFARRLTLLSTRIYHILFEWHMHWTVAYRLRLSLLSIQRAMRWLDDKKIVQRARTRLCYLRVFLIKPRFGLNWIVDKHKRRSRMPEINETEWGSLSLSLSLSLSVCVQFQNFKLAG